MIRSALLGAALLISLPAVAQTSSQPPGIPATGADLRAIAAACAPIPVVLRATPEVARACMGYQAGVVTGFLVLAQTIGLPATFCIPPTASDLDIEQAIVHWIGDDAERNAAPAATSIIAALIDRYPCRSESSAPPTPPTPR